MNLESRLILCKFSRIIVVLCHIYSTRNVFFSCRADLISNQKEVRYLHSVCATMFVAHEIV